MSVDLVGPNQVRDGERVTGRGEFIGGFKGTLRRECRGRGGVLVGVVGNVLCEVVKVLAPGNVHKSRVLLVEFVHLLGVHGRGAREKGLGRRGRRRGEAAPEIMIIVAVADTVFTVRLEAAQAQAARQQQRKGHAEE